MIVNTYIYSKDEYIVCGDKRSNSIGEPIFLIFCNNLLDVRVYFYSDIYLKLILKEHGNFKI